MPEEETEMPEEAETLSDSTKCEGTQHSVLLQVALKSVVLSFSFGAASLNGCTITKAHINLQETVIDYFIIINIIILITLWVDYNINVVG